MISIINSNYRDVDVPNDKTCVDIILDKAKEDPNRVAMINAETDEKITYGQLVTDVKTMASGLYEHGIRKGNIICICSANRPEMVVTMLSTWRIGAVVTTLNPSFTADEMIGQLMDSKATYFVTTPDVLPKLDSVKRKYHYFKSTFVLGDANGYISYQELLSCSPRDLQAQETYPSDVAILPYSSGTTGKPKGVILTHRNLAAITLILNHPDVAFFGDRQTTFSVFPLYHVGGFVINMINALYSLASIVYLPKYSFKRYLEVLQKYKVHLTSIPTPILLLLAKSPEVSHYDLSNLKHVTVGAAPTSSHIIEEAVKRLGLHSVRNSYGMTENSCLAFISPRNTTNYTAVGTLLPNLKAKIVDPSDGSTVPVGQSGELWLQGPITTCGYLGRRDATAELLTPDGWMRTGDVGYLDKAGYLYIVDRIKDVIKYNAYQVAPSELEAVLLSHPDVADAAVIGVPDEGAGELPAAYVVLKAGRSVLTDVLINYVKDCVAPYKRLRGGCFLVDSIPKNATGKILRRVLRDRIKKTPSKL